MKNKQAKLNLPLWKNYFSTGNQLLLLGIVVFGTVIRMINAISTPLWRDEIYIFFTSRDNSLWKLITQQHWDTAHPSLYFIFLHFWQMISSNPIILRLPSLILSFFILYLIPVLAVKLLRENKYFPFIFLFLFSISHTQISMNMVVRPYPFFILCMIISLILLLNMLEKTYTTPRTLIFFVVINTVLAYLDYSAIWLFSTYLIFFIWYFLLYKPKPPQLMYTFKALLLSACCALTVVPLLLHNLNHSFYLTRNFESVKMNQKTLKQGTSLYILINRNNRQISVYDKSLVKLAQTILPFDPFPNNRIYVGYDLSSLSLLLVNEAKICSQKRLNTNLGVLINSCKFQNIIAPLRGNMTDTVPSGIFDFSTRNFLGILNVRTNNWVTTQYKEDIYIGNNDSILLKLNLSSLYFFDPIGINIIGKLTKDEADWWRDITRFTIYPSEGHYRIAYYDGTSPNERSIFGEEWYLEKFSGLILFFSGLPDSLNMYIYYLVMMWMMTIGQMIHVYHFVRKKRYQLLLMFFLFYIPISFSFLVSYFFVPIFHAKNLHLVNLSYLCGISLFVTHLISYKGAFVKKWLNLLGVIILLFYTILFFIQFPYLHYVDPPYDVKKIIQKIEHSPLQNKYIILGNNKDYFALLRYELLFSKTLKVIPISSLGFLNSKEKLKTLSPNRKKSEDIFFIQFGKSKEKKGYDFLKMSKILDCNLKQVKIPYIYFAQCE